MSFLLSTFEVPLWFLVFAFACAAPLWFQWYQWTYRKFISTDVLQKKRRTEVKENRAKDEVLKKATENWQGSEEINLNGSDAQKSRRDNLVTEAEQPYVKIVLKTLALNGDAGILIPSLADKLEVNTNEIKKALSYLEQNEFVESVVGGSGAKYYLASRGRRYCIKLGYITK